MPRDKTEEPHEHVGGNHDQLGQIIDRCCFHDDYTAAFAGSATRSSLLMVKAPFFTKNEDGAI